MAKLIIVSMFDSKVSAFGPPGFVVHLGEALREWENAVNDPKSNPGKYPSDFQLYQLGEFDNSTGVFTPKTPELVASALEYKKKDPQEMLKGLDI